MRISRYFVAVFFLGCFASVAPEGLVAQTVCGTGVCVPTWHNDTYRTGQNLDEGTLTYNTINKDNFGQLCSAGLDGQVYAQPLVATSVTINEVFYPLVVYVVTQNDTLYAINGTPKSGSQTCQILKSLPFLSTSGLPTDGQFPADCLEIGGGLCMFMKPGVGILGTPVISVSGGTGTIYLVTETQDEATGASNWYHYLYSVDIQSLQVNSWVNVLPSGQCSGKGCFSQTHIQRPGLLFANCGSECGNKNYVYLAFSMMDGAGTPYPFGAVFGYNASKFSDTVFYLPTSLGSTGFDGGGIWMGGAGPAFGTDSSGQSWIYLTTGNGTFDLNAAGSDAGDSLLKLDPNNLSIASPSGGYGYFTPVDQLYRGNDVKCSPPKGNDVDFGPGGPMLIPDSQLTNWPYLAVTGDKEGGLWFVDRTNPGGYDTACSNTCSCTPAKSGNNIQTYWTGTPYKGTNIHGGMAFWEYDKVVPYLDWIYAAASGDQLFGYPLCTNPTASSPIDSSVCTGASSPVGSVNLQRQAINFPYGTTPSITANGQATDAVVWAIQNQGGSNPESTLPGVLYAFDAVSMQELYDSGMCAGDALNPATKFSVATVANEYVYVGTESANTNNSNKGFGTFYIFGSLTPKRDC